LLPKELKHLGSVHCLNLVLVEVWLDVWGGSAVDAKRFVVGADNNPLGPEGKVLQEDAWAWVLLPVEGHIRVAVAFWFVHKFSLSTFNSGA
jgi:hypothetical protein